MKYILSYGAGVNSTAMLIYLLENNHPLDLVIFADTWEESKATYDSYDFYKNHFSDAIEFVTVRSHHGKLYDYYYNKKTTPSRMRRDCTDKFKISPMRAYVRARYGRKEHFVFYLGIDYGELHRMKQADVKYIIQKYPLVDAKLDRDGCIKYIQDRNLPIPPKSGCWMCPFTKKQGWIDMKNNQPEMLKKAIALELNNRRYPESVAWLSSKPLIKLLDSEKGMTDFEHSCDVAGSCFT